MGISRSLSTVLEMAGRPAMGPRMTAAKDRKISTGRQARAAEKAGQTVTFYILAALVSCRLVKIGAWARGVMHNPYIAPFAIGSTHLPCCGSNWIARQQAVCCEMCGSWVAFSCGLDLPSIHEARRES